MQQPTMVSAQQNLVIHGSRSTFMIIGIVYSDFFFTELVDKYFSS